MTEAKQPQLSPAQRRIVEIYGKRHPWLGEWLNLDNLGWPQRRTIDALVSRGVLKEKYNNRWWNYWKLVPEAERVPVSDEDIPF